MSTIKVKNVTKEIVIPQTLWDELEPLLKVRDLELSDVVRLYARQLVLSSKKGRPMGLEDKFNFGKFKDETLELALKVEPDYIVWLIQNKDGFNLQPEALQLLEDLIGPEPATY